MQDRNTWKASLLPQALGETPAGRFSISSERSHGGDVLYIDLRYTTPVLPHRKGEITRSADTLVSWICLQGSRAAGQPLIAGSAVRLR